ncbi:OmpA family protein [Pyruvatibacter sp.]|uniref:OmpA family protein n=1 Tax=Pyruvatibacter sp. TaxID=1981328 RepID=UPI0032EF5DED
MTKHRKLAFVAPLAVAAALICLPTVASAQTLANDVEVNLDALGLRPGSGATSSEPRLILKYPGASTATRQVPQLRYPNVPAPTPRPTPPATSTPVAAAPDPQPALPATDPATDPARDPAPVPAVVVEAEPASKPKPVEAAAPPPPREPAEPAPAPAAEPAQQPAPVPVPVIEEAAAAPEPDPVETQVAALTDPAAPTLAEPEPAILSVVFDPEAAAIIGPARGQLDGIAESLRYDPRRIELKAYGGTPGDKTSDARRLSLKRGLAVRAYLIDLGIDSRRIDVRALGGVTDTGAADRVDVAYSGS